MKNWTSIAVGVLLATTAAPGAESSETLTPQQRASYAVGTNLGRNLRRDQVTLDDEYLMLGYRDAFEGKELLVPEADRNQAIQDYWNEIRAVIAERNLEAEAVFLAANQAKPGVVTLPSGLQYKVIREGNGTPPSATDTVTVHYRGTLTDGTEFDSSHSRGKPAEFQVNRVIKGWIEALQLMKPGAEWELYIPSALAYGTRGSGGKIGPNATLIFDIELLSAKPTPEPTNAAPRQPVTSDIIKVPSKAEMDKGAKIEVLKKEDVEKLLEEQKQQEKN